MPDLGKVKHNYNLMVQQGAPPEHITDYLDGLGVTVNDLKAYKAPKPGQEPTWADQVMDMARPMAPALAGQLIGAQFGGPIGAGIGGGIGEAYAQLSGNAPPSSFNMLMAELPGVGPAVRGVGSIAKLGLSGARARVLNRLGFAEIKVLAAKLAPKGLYKELFQQAEEEGGFIPLKKTLQQGGEAMTDLMKKVTKGDVPMEEVKYFQQLQWDIAKAGGGTTPARLQGSLAALGEKYSAATGETKAAYGKLLDGYFTDLDAAVASGGKGAATLKLARETFKRSMGIKTLENNLEGAAKILQGQGAEIQFNASQVLKNLKKDRFFESTFSASEQNQIKTTLEKLNKILPRLNAPRGVNYGSGKVLSRGAMEAAAGHMLGIDPVTAYMTAETAGYLRTFQKDISTLLSIDTGRKYLNTLFSNKGLTLPTLLAGIGVTARQELGTNQNQPASTLE